MKIFTKKLFLLVALIPWMSGISQYNINAIGTTQTIDFTGFDGSGFAPTPSAGQLDSDEWEVLGLEDGSASFGQSNTGGDFARGLSTGGVTSGGIYSFDNGTGASLGFQGSGADMTPGSLTLAIANNTGDVIEDLELTYEIWVYNDQNRANSFNFEHGSDNVSFTAEAALDFTTPELADGSPAWVSETKTITLTGVNIADGDNYYLKWNTDDVSGGGSRDEISIDNIELTGLGAGPTVAANPNTLTGFTQFVGSPSPEQTFDVTGSNLTDDVVVTVTNGDYLISETSGGAFSNSITLTQASGSVGPTTIYTVLDGTTAANPSNGEITITSTGASNATVVLEGQILNPDPTVFVSTNSITGFSHFVGTPSTEETFDVSGQFLTADLEVTAPANYEVSLSSGSGFGPSVSITNGGTVATTPIYVRLNGPAANYTQNGDITITSTGANTENISLEGETFDYTLYPIGLVTTNDANGEVDSLDVYVELRGIVHCIDFDGNDGYNFTIIDGDGDGINVFNFNDVDGYVVTEGDSIGVKGQIDQFNGLTQIFAEEIALFSQGNATQTPTVVTTLDESTESQLVTLENLTLVDGEATWPNNGNISVTDGTNTFTVRVPGASPLADENTPNGPFNITGLGGQFDNSAPYDEGYQLFPCSVEICNIDVTTTVSELTISAEETGVDYQWVDCNDDYAPITGETNQDFTASANGSYAVVITDGACVDTSACVEITTVSLTSNELSKNIRLYPNPVTNEMHINSTDEKIRSVEVYNTTGKSVLRQTLNVSNTTVSTSNWESGVYFVTIRTNSGNTTMKVVK